MAGAREIRTKIKSVANTRKVTRALEMVSASKIRKAQDLMRASRPYSKAMRQVIGHLAKARSEYKHPFLAERSEHAGASLSADKPEDREALFRQFIEWQKKQGH